MTRGLNVAELIERKCWWEGPEYLQNSESEWPANKVCSITSKQTIKEVKKKYEYIEGGYVNLVRSPSKIQCKDLQCDDKH